jgi:hypothetical protein
VRVIKIDRMHAERAPERIKKRGAIEHQKGSQATGSRSRIKARELKEIKEDGA